MDRALTQLIITNNILIITILLQPTVTVSNTLLPLTRDTQMGITTATRLIPISKDPGWVSYTTLISGYPTSKNTAI